MALDFEETKVILQVGSRSSIISFEKWDIKEKEMRKSLIVILILNIALLAQVFTFQSAQADDPKTEEAKEMWKRIIPPELLKVEPNLIGLLVSKDSKNRIDGLDIFYRDVYGLGYSQYWKWAGKNIRTIPKYLSEIMKKGSRKRDDILKALEWLLRDDENILLHKEYYPKDQQEIILRILGELWSRYNVKAVVPLLMKLLREKDYKSVRSRITKFIKQRRNKNLYDKKTLNEIIELTKDDPNKEIKVLSMFAKGMLAKLGDKEALQELIKMVVMDIRKEVERETFRSLIETLSEYPVEETISVLKKEVKSQWLHMAGLMALQNMKVAKLIDKPKLESALADVVTNDPYPKNQKLARRILYKIWDAEDKE